MKTNMGYKLLTLFLVGTMAFGLSCKSESDGGGSAKPGTISAKIDGKKFTSMEMTTFATRANNYINIQGNTGGTTSKAITIQIYGFDGAGTYSLSPNSLSNAVYMEIETNLSNPTNVNSKSWIAPYEGSGQIGQVVITEVDDTKIVGTFEFKGKNHDDDSIKNITDGSFNINFLSY